MLRKERNREREYRSGTTEKEGVEMTRKGETDEKQTLVA